jgi:hypothetical protein
MEFVAGWRMCLLTPPLAVSDNQRAFSSIPPNA